jgi:hypothetical protein
MFCSLKGFPPPDRFLINWLSMLNGLTDRNVVMKNLHVFLYSLFAVTNKHLAVLLAELSHNTTHTLELPKLTKEGIRKLPDSKQEELVSLTKSRQEILAEAFNGERSQGQVLGWGRSDGSGERSAEAEDDTTHGRNTQLVRSRCQVVWHYF